MNWQDSNLSERVIFLEEKAADLQDAVNNLLTNHVGEAGLASLSKSAVQEIKFLAQAVARVRKLPVDTDDENYERIAESVFIHGDALASHLETSHSEHATYLRSIVRPLKDLLDSKPLDIRGLNDIFNAESGNESSAGRNSPINSESRLRLEAIRAQQQLEKQIASSLEKVQQTALEFQGRIENANSKIEFQKRTIEDSAKKAGLIISEATGLGLGELYGVHAKLERRFHEVFRGLAITGIVVLALLVLIFAPPSFSNIDYAAFGKKASLVLLFSILIAIFSRESYRHRLEYLRLRQISLELTAFVPFIALLSETERGIAISKAADRFFPLSREKFEDGGTVLPTEKLLELAGKAIDKSKSVA